jgi:GT2 family glycosyltransferase/glycosyltransferase involved in cell wall biosynthesis
VAERDVQLASLNQVVAERDVQLDRLNQVVAERDVQLASLNLVLVERDENISNLHHEIAELEGKLSEVLLSTSWRITASFRSGVLWTRNLIGMSQRGFYNTAQYFYHLLPVKNNRKRMLIKTLVLKYFGRLLGRPSVVSSMTAVNKGRWKGIAARGNQLSNENVRDINKYLNAPAEQLTKNTACPVTRLMYYVWNSRVDLPSVFDLRDSQSRFEYCIWFLMSGAREYGFPIEAYPDELLVSLQGVAGGVGKEALAILEKKRNASRKMEVANNKDLVRMSPQLSTNGVNLIGYARGEFGMGEHVRMVARASAVAKVPFVVLDYQESGIHGLKDQSIDHWIGGNQKYITNIFHINADLFPLLYFKLGKEFFDGHYNIGYWAWELSSCPSEFSLAMNMVDEIWAISEFVSDSFKSHSSVPVINMPLAVSIPPLQRIYTKKYFGLSEDKFHFLFSFDAASHIDRKNPIATVRAFRKAFPSGKEKVELVLKTMNISGGDPLWEELMQEVRGELRVRVIDKRLTRDEVLGLNSVCDSFISLHRSEGFGRCLAESMLLGKPVIATNYSGSRDFARENTACVVDYKLIPVPEGAYPFWQGQEWAEPDIEHAAYLMSKVAADDGFRNKIAGLGQNFVRHNFNEEIIGNRYATRIKEINRQSFKSNRLFSNKGNGQLLDNDVQGLKEEIVVHIDSPKPVDDKAALLSVAIEISGWAVSKTGIEKIEIYCDDKFVGDAHYGILRPDLVELFQEYLDPGRAGFFLMLDRTNLSGGKYELTIVAYSKNSKITRIKQEFLVGDANVSYEQWIATNAVSEKQKKILCDEINCTVGTPLISVMVAAMACTNARAISRTIDSLNAQLYGNREFVLFVDEASALIVKEIVDVSDIAARVILVSPEGLLWSQIVDECRGDYMGVFTIGDVLDSRALLAVAKNIISVANVGLVYADEDRLENDKRVKPRFKPAWSPIYLESYNYIGRPWFGCSKLLRDFEIVGKCFNSRTEYNILKRLGKMANKVVHIPMVLCNCGDNELMDLVGDNKSEQDFTEYVMPTIHRQKGQKDSPLVSVIIPTCLHDLSIIEKCFSSILERTDYPNFEVLVVKNNVKDEVQAKRFLDRWPFKVIAWDGPFSWSGINNLGAGQVAGEVLLFMNDDVEAINPDWLTNMVAFATNESVGAVGAKLLYPNRTIQHGGISFVNYGGGARHLFRFCTGTEEQVVPLANHSRECSAVTGACLLSRRDVFEAVKGFDAMLPLVSNDTDYCLRLEEKGFVSVLAANATLLHHEGISRLGMSETDDVKRFWDRWNGRLESGDIFTNPNLDDGRDDWSVNPHALGMLDGRVRDGGRHATR